MFKTKKIKFDLKKRNFRWDPKSQDYIYEIINESEVHRIIIEYCRSNKIILKSIKIIWNTCTIKIKGTEQDVMNLVLYITKTFSEFIEDLRY